MRGFGVILHKCSFYGNLNVLECVLMVLLNIKTDSLQISSVPVDNCPLICASILFRYSLLNPADTVDIFTLLNLLYMFHSLYPNG